MHTQIHTRYTQHTDTHSGDLPVLCVFLCCCGDSGSNVSVQRFLVLNSAVIKEEKVWCGSDGGSLVGDGLTKMTKASADFFLFFLSRGHGGAPIFSFDVQHSKYFLVNWWRWISECFSLFEFYRLYAAHPLTLSCSVISIQRQMVIIVAPR